MRHLTLVLTYGALSLLGCGGEVESTEQPKSIRVTWGERTCQGLYAEGPYPAQDVFFDDKSVNAPVPPMFVPSADTRGWERVEARLDGTPGGNGLKIVACGVTLEPVIRVASTAPLTLERDFTWTGTRTSPCNTSSTPPPSTCRVVQRIVYPLDAPKP